MNFDPLSLFDDQVNGKRTSADQPPALIERVVGDEQVPTVDSRQLHRFLGSGQQFSHWITARIEQCQFVEGIDFVTFREFSLKGRPSQEYALSIDMAKEIAMLEHNKRGREARRYFISCEKQLRQAKTTNSDAIAALNDPVTLRKLLLKNVEQVIALEAKISEDRPKVEFHDAVTGSVNSRDLLATAHVLDIGRTTLLRKLRAMGHVQQREVLPYRQYELQGLYEVEQRHRLDRKTGEQVRYEVMMVTGKGLQYLQQHLPR